MIALLIQGTGLHVEIPLGGRLVAIDTRVLALRPLLARSIGLDALEAVDDALAAISSRAPLLIVGPRGLGEAAWLDALDGPVLRVDLDAERLTVRRAVQLFAMRDARVVFRAVKSSRARYVLGRYTARVRTVLLVPLIERQMEIVPLLDAIMRQLGEANGAAVLGDAVTNALARYAWPRNVEELTEHATRLLALRRHRTVRAAALALGVTHQTLGAHLHRVGVEIESMDRAPATVPRSGRTPSP